MSETPRTDAECFRYLNGEYAKFGCCRIVSEDFAQRLETELAAARTELAALKAELGKLNDPVAVHINMLRGTIATPSRELMAHVWQEPQPVPLDRPDKVGWWWCWSKAYQRWDMEIIGDPEVWQKGKWIYAEPPRDLREEN